MRGECLIQNSLGPDATFEEISKFAQSYSTEQLDGLTETC